MERFVVKGQILDFSVQENTGTISGEDGKRYHFAGAEWKGDRSPARGMTVDFDTDGEHAKEVYVALGKASDGGLASGAPSRLTAGLLAIFLGPFGIHKFYLGFNVPGIICLVGTILIIPFVVIGPLVFIEGIIYLTKSDEEFERLYVVEKKQWF